MQQALNQMGNSSMQYMQMQMPGTALGDGAPLTGLTGLCCWMLLGLEVPDLQVASVVELSNQLSCGVQ